MKQFIPSFQALFYLIISISIISCHDDNTEPAKLSIPLIEKITSYDSNGSLYSTTTFQYDANGRLLERKTPHLDSTFIEYTLGKAIVTEYTSNGPLDMTTTTYRLNDQSLAISAISIKDNSIETFTYDKNGYCKTSCEVVFHSILNTTYKLSNQNYVTIITDEDYLPSAPFNPSQLVLTARNRLSNPFKKELETQNNLKSATASIDTWRTEYEFYTDHKNTIENENMGIYFLGKQNLNPIKREVLSSEEMLPISHSYTYEYDAEGRIAKKIYESGIYEVFTYIE